MSQELNLYEYAVLRYVPSVEREEFVNVGLVMMCKRRRWLRIAVHIDEHKLEVFRCPHTSFEILSQLDGFRKVCSGSGDGAPISKLTVEERFRWITAVKSASLATSRPHPGKTCDLDAEFDRLFSILVL